MNGRVETITFDMFGTILDLTNSLTPVIQRVLGRYNCSMDPNEFWNQFRARQRLEQYQNNLLMLGHCGYLEAVRRAFIYTLRLNAISYSKEDVNEFIDAWKYLAPFVDVLEGLKLLKDNYELVILSNGEEWFLKHLVDKQIKFHFDKIISAETIGVFKPHPSVYRTCTRILSREPYELMMVSSNSFDILGSRTCGYTSAWVNRHRLPYEETSYLPTIIVKDFLELSRYLLGSK